MTYEPSHRQNGQNSTEYNGFKLIKALKVVQNLYLMDVSKNLLDELDAQELLIRRIKGFSDFLKFGLTNKD